MGEVLGLDENLIGILKLEVAIKARNYVLSI